MATRYSVVLACFLALSSFTSALFAETVEQKIRLDVIDPGDGSQCMVNAVFLGEHDNCDNKKAGGRGDCSKDDGCVCTRQEKHISWQMEHKEGFTIRFDQGSENPFVKDGQSECNLKSNKGGKLRCRVKGKNVPRGTYRYSIEVAHCAPARTHIKVY